MTAMVLIYWLTDCAHATRRHIDGLWYVIFTACNIAPSPLFVGFRHITWRNHRCPGLPPTILAPPAHTGIRLIESVIRAGSAGGMQEGVGAGDVVVATGAVREDGLSPKLVPLSYPALVAPEVLIAMRAAAAELAVDYHEGIVLTSDMFYPHEILGSDLPLWQRAGVTAVEMELATLLVVCSLHGVQAGGVAAIDGNPLAQDDGSMETYDPNQDSVKIAVANCLQIALRALIS